VVTGHDDLAAGDWADRCRELFLTDLWSLLIDEDERAADRPSWIESWFRGVPEGAVPQDPTAAALSRILASGADADDLTDVVRAMQHEIIYNVCQLLDDPSLLGIRGDVPPGEARAGWELTAVRDAPPDRRPIGELHSELDARDPSGRGGEPRGRPLPAVLPGLPSYAGLAVAQARAGDRLAAIKTWRAATGASTAGAKAAIDALLSAARQERPGG
jgi:hypothetical protein